MQRPSGTGLEPVNGAMISWRDANFWWSHITKPQKGHTHTHPPTRPPPGSDHPWYLWETLLTFFFLGGTNQTKEKSQEQNLHLVSPWSFFCRGWRCPRGWKGWELVPPLIGSLFWLDVMNQWLFLLRPRLHRSHLQYPALHGWTFMTFCIWIMQIALGEGWVNLDICPLERVRNHNTLPIFQVRKIYFPLHLEIQNGINCPGHTSPAPVLFHTVSLTLRKWFKFYFLKVKLSVWFQEVKWFPERTLESLLLLWSEEDISTKLITPPALEQAPSSS